MKKWNGIGKERSLIVKATLRLVLSGMIMIFMGITNYFDPKGVSVVTTIISCILILLMLVAILSKYEKDDEMSKAHLQRAIAKGCALTLLIACFTSIGCVIGDYFGYVLSAKLSIVLPIIIGLSLSFSGILFIKYERKGIA